MTMTQNLKDKLDYVKYHLTDLLIEMDNSLSKLDVAKLLDHQFTPADFPSMLAIIKSLCKDGRFTYSVSFNMEYPVMELTFGSSLVDKQLHSKYTAASLTQSAFIYIMDMILKAIHSHNGIYVSLPYSAIDIKVQDSVVDNMSHVSFLIDNKDAEILLRSIYYVKNYDKV